MIIDRNIINDNINYDGYTKQDICNKINRFKRLFKYKYGLQKGDTVCVLLLEVDITHVACVIAIAEMGLKLFLANKPVCLDTVHATKMGIYGPMDLTVTKTLDPFGNEWNPAHTEMIKRYSKQHCDPKELDELHTDDDITLDYTVDPSDILIFGSTSGTTLQKSKPVYYSHKHAYEWHMTNALHSNRINSDSRVMITLNLHHASSLLAYLTPALQVVDNCYNYFIADMPNIPEFVQRLIDHRIDHTMVHAMYFEEVLSEIEKRKDDFQNRVTFLVTGFPLTEDKYDLCKRAPININSIYGSMEVGGVFSNFVDENSVYKENNIGHVVQDYEVFEEEDGMYVIYHPRDEVKRKLNDIIYYDGESYIYVRRDEELPKLYPFDFRYFLVDVFNDWTLIYRDGQPDLVVWDEYENGVDFSNAAVNLPGLVRKIFYLKKKDFMDSTKLSMEQVKAYVENN